MSKKKKKDDAVDELIIQIEKTNAQLQADDEKLSKQLPGIVEQQIALAELFKPSLEESERLAKLLEPDPSLIEAMRNVADLATAPAMALQETFGSINQQNKELSEGLASMARSVVGSLDIDLSGFTKLLDMDWGKVEKSLVSSLPAQLDIRTPIYELFPDTESSRHYELLEEVKMLRHEFGRLSDILEKGISKPPTIAKRRGGAQSSTKDKLNRLLQFRDAQIANGQQIPGRLVACHQILVSVSIARKHASILWARWEDYDYRPSEVE